MILDKSKYFYTLWRIENDYCNIALCVVKDTHTHARMHMERKKSTLTHHVIQTPFDRYTRINSPTLCCITYQMYRPLMLYPVLRFLLAVCTLGHEGEVTEKRKQRALIYVRPMKTKLLSCSWLLMFKMQPLHSPSTPATYLMNRMKM